MLDLKSLGMWPWLIYGPSSPDASDNITASDGQRVFSEYSLLEPAFSSPSYLALLDRRGPTRLIDADGAVGQNRGTYSYISAQRDALWVLERALAKDDAAGVEAAMRAIEYGFVHQADEPARGQCWWKSRTGPTVWIQPTLKQRARLSAEAIA